MLNFLDKIPYSVLTIFTVMMLLVPVKPLPHLYKDHVAENGGPCILILNLMPKKSRKGQCHGHYETFNHCNAYGWGVRIVLLLGCNPNVWT